MAFSREYTELATPDGVACPRTPFVLWKEMQKQKDGGLIHPKGWYYQAYGNYCKKVDDGSIK